MAWSIEHLDQLREYLDGVVGRADHHANEASEIAFALAGAIVYFADPDSPIEVREGRDPSVPANQLRIRVHGTPYVFSWSHSAKKILVKERNQQGPVVAQFDNASSCGQVRAFFQGLR